MSGKPELLIAEIGVGVEKCLPLRLEIGIVGAQGQEGEEPPFEIELEEVHRSSSKRESDASPGGARAAIPPRIDDGDRDIEEQHQRSHRL